MMRPEGFECLLEPVVKRLGYELLGVEYIAHRSGLLRVYIDREEGISHADCALVTRYAGAILDVEAKMSTSYLLEVSSPGLDRPLFKAEHYERFLSHRVKVVMRIAQQGRRRFTGVLKALTKGIVAIEVDHRLYELPLADIASARLVP